MTLNDLLLTMANCNYVPDLLYVLEVQMHCLLEKLIGVLSKNVLFVMITGSEEFCS